MPGSLSDTDNTSIKLGYLSFVRLVGTVYFKKNLASIVSKLGLQTPEQLFNSLSPAITDEERHKISRSALETVLLDKRNVEKFHEG
jgi:hypothetical protein